MSLTRRLRDELCGVTAGSASARVAETSALLRHGGAWTVREGSAGWVLDTGVLSVLRHARQSLTDLLGASPTVEAHEPGGLSRRTRYRLRVSGAGALAALGLADDEGHPLPSAPAWVTHDDETAVAYVRGALLAAGGLSGPGKAPHLEVRAPSAQAAADLRALLARLGVEGVSAAPHGDGSRVVSKSGEDIGRVLALTGAHGTFLAFDEGRLRRQLRGEATRAANADRANVGRAVEASSRQVRSIEALLDGPDWERLPADVQEIALARLANPQASLAELAGLLDVPRATVHRKLLRLERDASDTRPLG